MILHGIPAKCQAIWKTSEHAKTEKYFVTMMYSHTLGTGQWYSKLYCRDTYVSQFWVLRLNAIFEGRVLEYAVVNDIDKMGIGIKWFVKQ